jgi:hypothetical protein
MTASFEVLFDSLFIHPTILGCIVSVLKKLRYVTQDGKARTEPTEAT